LRNSLTGSFATRGNAAETDEQVREYTKELAEWVAQAFPGVQVEIVDGPVGYAERCPDGDLGHEIRDFINDVWGDVIDAVEARLNGGNEVRS
jgi:hypothetical protein